MDIYSTPDARRPEWVAEGHTFEREPLWTILPSGFAPICDSCHQPCNQPHKLDTHPPASTTTPRREPHRYWGD